MKIKLKLYKIFPYLLFYKKLKGKYGTTKGPVVMVDPETSNSTTLEHEEVHVAIWWITTLLATPIILWPLLHHYTFNLPLLMVAFCFGALADGLLGFISKTHKKHEEAFCYGRSAKLSPDMEAYINHYKASWERTYGEDFIELVREYSTFFNKKAE